MNRLILHDKVDIKSMETLKRRRVDEDVVDASDDGGVADRRSEEPAVKCLKRVQEILEDCPADLGPRTVAQDTGKTNEEAFDVPQAAPVDSPVDFYDLENELVIKIFSYLSLKDLLRSACRVNRKWHKLSRAPELWRRIVLDVNKLELKQGMDYRPKLITDDILNDLTSRSEGIQSIDLTDCNALTEGNGIKS